jgi:hypothetical protein
LTRIEETFYNEYSKINEISNEGGDKFNLKLLEELSSRRPKEIAPMKKKN